jgi:hypothetical protein
MKTVIEDVLETYDYGRPCWDVVVPARDIHRMWKHGLIKIDPENQRGKNNVTQKEVYKKEKVERWARELQEGTAVFGQLTWNFRPEETKVYFDNKNRQFIIESGAATLPDSGHRHRAIALAVESVAQGSDFDIAQKFSIRIWHVGADEEPKIFYWMNQEGDKADATRSKWLHQKTMGEKLAQALVRSSPFLGRDNVETVTNSLSKKNPRLAAFNTFSVACETSWNDIADGELEAVSEYLCSFWEHLVEVRPELQRLDQPARQKWREESISVAAIAIHGYMGLARRIYDGDFDFSPLEALNTQVKVGRTAVDFFSFENPIWRERGIVSMGKNDNYTIRNALQTRREVIRLLAEQTGVAPEQNEAAAE